MSISRLTIVGAALAGVLAVNVAQAQSSQTHPWQQQPQAGQPSMQPREATSGEATSRPYAVFPLQMVFGSNGYFEVTPAGALILYPVWNAMDPEVMYTIFAMMGSTSLVNRRGYYEVAYGDGGERQVHFFLPPGTTPGFIPDAERR